MSSSRGKNFSTGETSGGFTFCPALTKRLDSARVQGSRNNCDGDSVGKNARRPNLNFDVFYFFRFTYYDYAVFIAMLTCSGALGLYCAFNGGPQNTIRQLLAADGQLPPILVSTSLMASFISASYILGEQEFFKTKNCEIACSVFLLKIANQREVRTRIRAYLLLAGNVAEIFQNGTMYFFMLLSYCLVIPVTAHLYLPVFYNSGVLTCYEVRPPGRALDSRHLRNSVGFCCCVLLITPLLAVLGAAVPSSPPLRSSVLLRHSNADLHCHPIIRSCPRVVEW